MSARKKPKPQDFTKPPKRHAMTPPPDDKEIETEELQCTACPFCEGVGSISYNPNLNPNAFEGTASARCEHCDGSGVAADDDDDETDRCPTCEGSGTSWDGICECLDCGGTGH